MQRTFFHMMGGDDCDCPDGYVDNTFNQCVKTEEIPASVTQSNYCVVYNPFTVYSQYFTRIYKPGFSNSSISQLSSPFDTLIELSTPYQWKNHLNDTIAGPMNRSCVWIDSDCSGSVDALASGTKVTLSYIYNNTGVAKTIYVGIGGDNQFQLIVNGNTIAQTLDSTSQQNFKIWHVFPVNIVSGTNYFNLVATGDGTINDSIGMIIYNNTAQQLIDCNPSGASGTVDNGLDILFSSGSLAGNHIDVATCPLTYTLDASGGSGHYKCVRNLITTCD